MEGYERIQVDAPSETVVATLRTLLKERNFTEYAVVDHGRDMAAAGHPGHHAWTLIFGNPAAGARLLASDRAAAVDIPLRLAVIASDEGSEIVWRDMRTAARRHRPGRCVHRRAADPRKRGPRPVDGLTGERFSWRTHERQCAMVRELE